MQLKNSGRYNDYSFQSEFEPGSRSRVLKNLLGIKCKREMDVSEWKALDKAFEDAIHIYDVTHCFTSRDILKLHKIWLEKIYPWAGQYRRVNISKGKFHFAAANQIEKLMNNFEKHQLKKYTPCNFLGLEQIAEAIAIVHVELILIHPFRDGNGRVSRLLANLMALQAGLPPLNFNGLGGHKKREYIRAVQIGHAGNYKPMIKIFESVIKRTLRTSS